MFCQAWSTAASRACARMARCFPSMPNGHTYPLSEERRLFYVALTRARRPVAMFTLQGKHSPFLDELVKDGAVEVTAISGAAIHEERCPVCKVCVFVDRNGPHGLSGRAPAIRCAITSRRAGGASVCIFFRTQHGEARSSPTLIENHAQGLVWRVIGHPCRQLDLINFRMDDRMEQWHLATPLASFLHQIVKGSIMPLLLALPIAGPSAG